MRRDDLIRMRHMLDAAQNAMTFAVGQEPHRPGLSDPLLAYALCKAIEVIGEAASKVSSRFTGASGRNYTWPAISGALRKSTLSCSTDRSPDISWHIGVTHATVFFLR